jgi:hypothetical protein
MLGQRMQNDVAVCADVPGPKTLPFSPTAGTDTRLRRLRMFDQRQHRSGTRRAYARHAYRNAKEGPFVAP